jgi:hypothetical protein
MSANLEQTILEKLQALPDNKQEEVLALVDEMLKETHEPSTPKNVRPIWEIITELSAQVPMEEWEKLPTDGAEQHDHYLYGAPKRHLPVVAPTGNPITHEQIND